MSEFVGRPILFGFNPHRVIHTDRDRQNEQEGNVCNNIQMWCCIVFTLCAITYLIAMVILIIILDSPRNDGNQIGSQLNMIDVYFDSLSGSLSGNLSYSI